MAVMIAIPTRKKKRFFIALTLANLHNPSNFNPQVIHSPMSHDEVSQLTKEFTEVHLRLDAFYKEQFKQRQEQKQINDEIKQLISAVAKQNEEQMDTIRPITEAYLTIKNGSVWIKYAFWLIGSIFAAILAIREFFKK